MSLVFFFSLLFLNGRENLFVAIYLLLHNSFWPFILLISQTYPFISLVHLYFTVSWCPPFYSLLLFLQSLCPSSFVVSSLSKSYLDSLFPDTISTPRDSRYFMLHTFLFSLFLSPFFPTVLVSTHQSPYSSFLNSFFLIPFAMY